MKSLTSLFLFGPMILFLAAFHPILAAQNSSTPGKPQATADPKNSPAGSSSVDPAQPVITITGLCRDTASKSAGKSSSCSKTITREEFERLLSALSPGGASLPENARQMLARTYAEALAFEAAAKREGLVDTVQYREVLEFVRLRTIADLYRRGLQEKARTPTQDEIDAYYKQHLSEYERVKIARILIPRENPSSSDKDAFDKKAREAADAAREHLAQGAEAATVQQNAYTALGLKLPPPTDMGTLGRSAFMEKESADIFALPLGGVTPVEVEAKNYVIYKVTSKDTLGEEQLKGEITRTISQQKLKDAIKAVTDGMPAVLNEEYFGKNPPAPALPPRMPR